MKEIELAPHIAKDTRDLLYKLVRLNPNERPDIYAVLNHPALAPYRQMPCLSSAEYQIMLRNYMLNTQGTNNRNLPDELEKFINVYNDKPQQKAEPMNNAQHKEITTPIMAQNGVHTSQTLTRQVQEAPRIQPTNNNDVLKKDYFDDISKVIELENKSAKPQIFKKVNDQHSDLNNIDSFNFQDNKRVEKHTNFFENINSQSSQSKPDFQTLAPLSVDADPSFVKTDGGIMALKNLSPSTVNGNSQTTKGHSSEINGVQESLPKTYVSEKRVQSFQEFNFAKPNLIDVYNFQSNEQNTVDSYGSNRSTAGPTLCRNYSSDSNELLSRSLLSKLRNNSGIQNSERLLSGPNSLGRPEPILQPAQDRSANFQPSRFANTLLSRPQILPLNKTISKPNLSQEANAISTEYRSNAQVSTLPAKPFDDKSTNIFNSSIEIGSSKRKQENNFSKFVNAPIELKPTSVNGLQGANINALNGANVEEIKQNMIRISQSEISARDMAKINRSHPINLYQPISHEKSKLQKVASIEASLQRNEMSNGGLYSPMEVNNIMQNNRNIDSKGNRADINFKEKNTLTTGISQAVLNKSNSMQVFDLQNKLVRATTPLEITMSQREKLNQPKKNLNDQANNQFISFMSTLQNDQQPKDVMADAHRRTSNSFVNYNDEDNKRYLQTLNFSNSSKHLNVPSLKTEGRELLLNELFRGTLTSKRQTAPEQIGSTNTSYNRPIPSIGSKLQSRPLNTMLNKTHFSKP